MEDCTLLIILREGVQLLGLGRRGYENRRSQERVQQTARLYSVVILSRSLAIEISSTVMLPVKWC